jgi:SAM-dependent methyltransferase
MRIKSHIPWQVKIATKILLSRLPVAPGIWKKAGLFEHGSMEQPDYAFGVFKKHFDRASHLVSLQKEFVCLELGPGESLFTAIITRAFGGAVSYLVDAGEYAVKDVQRYQAMASYLGQKGSVVPDIKNLQTLEKILACYSAHYETEGLSSLKAIPDESVDFIFSHAVLEHIKRSEFLDTMRELRRIIRNNGVCSHQIDLKDHLSSSLNNLRFPENMWESDLMSRSGFYTNRIRYSEMLDLFRSASFEPEVIEKKCWPRLPLPRSKLSKSFRIISDDELCINDFSVLLKPV